MSAARPKVAIVVSHGSLARGLVSAMETVLGAQRDVFWLSNTGRSPAQLQSEIESLIASEAPDADVYLLTDLRGGSCASTCLRSSRAAGVRGVFYGANLTLLLEFVLHRDLPGAEFFQTVLAKARGSVDGVRFPRVGEAAEASGAAGAPGAAAASGAAQPASAAGSSPAGAAGRASEAERDPAAAARG